MRKKCYNCTHTFSRRLISWYPANRASGGTAGSYLRTHLSWRHAWVYVMIVIRLRYQSEDVRLAAAGGESHGSCHTTAGFVSEWTTRQMMFQHLISNWLINVIIFRQGDKCQYVTNTSRICEYLFSLTRSAGFHSSGPQRTEFQLKRVVNALWFVQRVSPLLITLPKRRITHESQSRPFQVVSPNSVTVAGENNLGRERQACQVLEGNFWSLSVLTDII